MSGISSGHQGTTTTREMRCTSWICRGRVQPFRALLIQRGQLTTRMCHPTVRAKARTIVVRECGMMALGPPSAVRIMSRVPVAHCLNLFLPRMGVADHLRAGTGQDLRPMPVRFMAAWCITHRLTRYLHGVEGPLPIREGICTAIGLWI